MDGPTPLDGPLPGGTPGTTVRLHPIRTGEVHVPPGLLELPGGPLGRLKALGLGVNGEDRLWIPAPAFLIEHPSAGAVLVDTGLHPDAPHDKSAMGRSANMLYDFRIGAGESLPEQLTARGVQPDDVRTVVITHLHTDHASAICDYPQATFVVAAQEWRAAMRADRVMHGYERRHFDHDFDWRTVDHAATNFDSGFDLFGDGSVRLLPTPGHTAGHQSVLLRLGAERQALIAADAAYTRATIADGVVPGVVGSAKRFRESLGQIQRFAAEHPDALVIPGHDAAAWAQLDAVYD